MSKLNLNIAFNISWLQKIIEILLKKSASIFWIIIDNQIFSFININENQYVIWLFENWKHEIFKWVQIITIKIYSI